MSKTITLETPKEEKIDYKAEVIKAIEEVSQKLMRIGETQERTARLRDETESVLARLKRT
ncbi:MAG: hypothetical protein MSG64_02555 [Pyrinomonadaceae bacterium MAG19_C2-C3]|nr:hypothetical protein [Pyrinomonadaceae bacterium MAG19_C2-C3]